MSIRRARPDDAARLLEIYAPVVEETTASFELVAPTVEAFAKRIAAALETHEWLVMEDGDALCGYAYATAHRAREAYRFAVETSVYVSRAHHRKGVGRQLYAALFPILSDLGYHNAYAGITLPNDPSVALHESVGFEPIGTFREVGYKHGEWRDVGWWQRSLSAG